MFGKVGYWIPNRRSLFAGKYKCLRQSVQMEPGVYETTLVCRRGEIFINSDTDPDRRYQVLFFSCRSRKATERRLGFKVEDDRKCIVSEKDADKWIKALGIIRTWKAQLLLLNAHYGYCSTGIINPGSRVLPRARIDDIEKNSLGLVDDKDHAKKDSRTHSL